MRVIAYIERAILSVTLWAAQEGPSAAVAFLLGFLVTLFAIFFLPVIGRENSHEPTRPRVMSPFGATTSPILTTSTQTETPSSMILIRVGMPLVSTLDPLRVRLLSTQGGRRKE